MNQLLPDCLPIRLRSGIRCTRRGLRRPALWLALATILVAVYCPAQPALAYELGKGYSLPWLGLNLGGYLTLKGGKIEGEPAQVTLQDLSLLISATPAPLWRFFGELELGNPLTWNTDGPTLAQSDFDVERLYVDRNLTPFATLRLGKILTPIGRWNQIHADPLVWSVFRPLTTASPFSRHATGAAMLGTWSFDESEFDYQVYLDDTQALDPGEGDEPTYLDTPVQPNPRNAFDRGGGVRLLWRAMDDALQVGLSAAQFTLTHNPGTKDLVGADLFYSRSGLELTGEAVYRWGTGPNGDVWGGFGQLVVPLVGRIYGVLSAERYKGEGYSQATDSARVGLAYRPVPALTFKLEVQESGGNTQLAPEGWQLSVSALF